jgi:alpha-soluble NSF attachment protein
MQDQLINVYYDCCCLRKAVEGYDADAFAQACADYDRITPLDPWKTSMLVKVKRHIASSEVGADEDPDLT